MPSTTQSTNTPRRSPHPQYSAPRLSQPAATGMHGHPTYNSLVLDWHIFNAYQAGPNPRHVPTFMSDTAIVLSAPLSCTAASCAASASNLLGALSNGSPVSRARAAATASAKPGEERSGGNGELKTAVLA